MKSRLIAALALAVVLVPRALADARVDEWIAKARAAVGSESTLNTVRSIHFVGKLATTQKVPVSPGATLTKDEPVVLALDIVFQKPDQQRMTLRSDKIVQTTALDGYDAWTRRADATDEKKRQLTLLDAEQVRQLRANTWENLSFYRGIEKRGGNVTFDGDVTVDGKACVKLVFTHPGFVVFTRYIDKSTGRLVRSDTDAGGEIREEGEILAGGLRFPRTLVSKSAGGQVTTITFEQITVNENFSRDEFAVPSLMPN